MIHYCLEQILKQYDRDAFLALTPEKLLSSTVQYAEKFWENEMGGDFSKSFSGAGSVLPCGFWNAGADAAFAGGILSL